MNNMIYFDNGATSFPKPQGMVEVMNECISNYCGNPGRSGHYMSTKTGEEIYKARKDIAKIFNIDNPARLIFVKNTTEGLNIAIKGLLNEGDHVVTTAMEHNSVLRPLKELEEKKVSHTIVNTNTAGELKVKQIKEALRENTTLVIITAASNITGTKMPIKEIGKMLKNMGIYFMVDGAQGAGAMDLNVQENCIDILAFPGHKGLLGPMGTGGLYIREDIMLRPLILGGTGTESKKRIQPLDLPEGFEAGTMNAPGIIGLGYSTNFIKKIGIRTIEFYERELIMKFDEAVRNMENVSYYGPEASGKTGISLFNIKGIECEEVTSRMNNEYGIAVRGGFHCAGLAHRTIGTWRTGAVRLSVGPFNTRKQIQKAINAVWNISVDR